MVNIPIFKYFRHYKGKFLSIFLALFLSITLLYTIQMLIHSIFNTHYLAFVEPYKVFSRIAPEGQLLENDLIDNLRKQKNIERMAPCVFGSISFDSSFEKNVQTTVMELEAQDIQYLMSKADLKIIQGRLPEPGSREIIIHRLVAANKRLKVGDRVGNLVDKNEALIGEYTVSGILDGSSLLSFTSFETYLAGGGVQEKFRIGVVLFPEGGCLNQMNEYLDSLPPQYTQVRTLNTERRKYNEAYAGIDSLISIIGIIEIIIVSICAGFLSYIYFSQRRREFGLLSALGHTHQEIIYYAFYEISLINFLGFVVSILVSLCIGIVLNYTIFTVKGQPLELLSTSYILRVACIPVFTTLFSVFPIWRMLRKLDAISIIEGIG
ncbi:MAG: ABC transporter permease [Bacillota bacterium]|nr:ABC transporter permease [Bacillota bacterium]